MRSPNARRRAGSRSTSESGQALVEVALIAPILILLIMAIFQFAFVFETQMGITNAVREAARRAAAVEDPTAAWVREQLCGSNPAACSDPSCGTSNPINCPLLPMNVQGFSQTRLAASNPVITFCTYNVAGVDQYRVAVAVTYTHPEFFPLQEIASMAASNPAGAPWGWTFTVSSEMRIEQGLASAPPACA